MKTSLTVGALMLLSTAASATTPCYIDRQTKEVYHGRLDYIKSVSSTTVPFLTGRKCVVQVVGLVGTSEVSGTSSFFFRPSETEKWACEQALIEAKTKILEQTSHTLSMVKKEVCKTGMKMQGNNRIIDTARFGLPWVKPKFIGN